MSADTIWGLVGVVVLGFFAAKWIRHRILRINAKKWPIAMARVQQADLRMERRGGTQWVHVAEIVYSYDVLGKLYSNRWLRSTILDGKARKWIDGNPAGAVLPVRYDPQKPQTSVVLEGDQAPPQRLGAG
jgi:hypothetical protein